MSDRERRRQRIDQSPLSDLAKRLLLLKLGEGDDHDAEQLAAEIVAELGPHPPSGVRTHERITWLRQIGIMFPSIAAEYRFVIEPLLDRTDDPSVVEAGLWTLLCWFGPAPYVERLVELLQQNEWDPWHELWRNAVSAAGEYLTTHQDPRLLKRLIEVVGDTEVNPVIRANAYAAIHTALGYEPELSWIAAEPMLDHPDAAMLAAARERLEREAAQS